MSSYYNEFDKGAAAWLRELIRRGLIAPGDVDERSIVDVRPDDLAGYRQCHFFAGIGGWALAARLAGWPDDRPVWTGSCPCQPFSAAGKGAGFADERHLWPQFHYLIEQCRPDVVFGEQVASKDGLAWFDLVQADLEGTGYACGAVDLCAAGLGAPHIRQRLWWVAQRLANADDAGLEGRRRAEERAVERAVGQGGVAGGLADATEFGRERGRPSQASDGRITPRVELERFCDAGGLADADSTGLQSGKWNDQGARHGHTSAPTCGDDRQGAASPTNGFWRDADWLFCRDGKWRPVEPGTQQMVDGISRGMGLLRADHIAKEEMNHATEAVGLADQVLRALRSGHGAQAVWGSLGGCVGLPEATLLLASLCQQSRELGWFFDRATAGGAPGGEGIVRAVRQGAPEAACASPGRGCTEQLAWELGDALPELSQACPSARQHLDQLRQFTGSPLAHGIPARVGRLRGYGNAIVPQVAAEFIGAFLDVTETS